MGLALLKYETKQAETALPVQGGRSSVDSNNTTYGALISELMTTVPKFRVEFLETLENLAMYNADLSYAVQNIVSLGSTDYRVEFDQSVSDEEVEKMLTELKKCSKNWYNRTGGLSTMINDMLTQIAITGARSFEMVPDSNLTGIANNVIVSPSQIRFKYNKETDTHEPYQEVPVGAFKGIENLIKLNPTTYKYQALTTFSGNPTAIPPFLSSLESISIEKSMICSLRKVVEKLGAFGFLEVLLSPPSRITSPQLESEEAYELRVKKYIQAQQVEIEKGLANGYAIGLDGKHTMKMMNTTTTVEGAKGLFELMNTMKFAGLKQDPSMLGRNYTTTETLGRVLLAKLGTQIKNYQRLVAEYLEDMFTTHLLLKGYEFEFLDVEFEEPMIGDELRDAQVENQRILNARELYNDGLISQDQRAASLDLDGADQDEPRMVIGVPASAGEDDDPKGTDPNKEDDATDPKTTENKIKVVAKKLNAHLPQFNYGEGCTDCSGPLHSFAKSDDPLFNKWLQRYAKATGTNYKKAVNLTVDGIADRIAELGAGATEQQVLDAVIFEMYNNWDRRFITPQRAVISKMVKESYNAFRRDKKYLGGLADVPDAVFDTLDIRTISYYKDSDNLYLGKFITDDDTKRKLEKMIREDYLNSDLPIGDRGYKRGSFRKKLGGVLVGEEYKIQRVINTTVNKLRNYATVNYMQQAEVERYIVRGIKDNLQCQYCENMQGKVMYVNKAVSHVKDHMNSSPDAVGFDSPFLTSIFKGDDIDSIKELSGEQLQELGIHTPPYHPNCRDVIVVDI